MSRREITPRHQTPEEFLTNDPATFRRAVIAWLRGDDNAIPPYIPDEWIKTWAADWLELESKTAQERRVIRGRRRREDAATVLRLQIFFTATKKGISQEKAIKEIAASKGLEVESLKQALKPSSISGENRRKKSKRS